MSKFIDLLGYREITFKSDTGPVIIAFRNRVAAICKTEVTTEDGVKGDKESNGLIENTVMLIRGIIRTIKCHTDSSTQEPLSDDSPGGWSTQVASSPGVSSSIHSISNHFGSTCLTGIVKNHGVVSHGSCAHVDKTIKSLKWSTAEQNRWLKNHSQLTVAKHLRDKTHSSLLFICDTQQR